MSPVDFHHHPFPFSFLTVSTSDPSLLLPSYSDCSIFTHFNHSESCLLIVVFLTPLPADVLFVHSIIGQGNFSLHLMISDTCRMYQPLIRSQVTFPEGVNLISSRDLCDCVSNERSSRMKVSTLKCNAKRASFVCVSLSSNPHW